jgi:hypothetical protein
MMATVKGLFLVESPHEQNLPLMENLQFVDESGKLVGGWWVVGPAPTQNTVIVCVETSAEQLDEMADDPAYFYLGDVAEEGLDG